MVESDYLQEKALAKVNLTFRILGKETKNYHSISSIVTFLPDLYDNVFIKKNKKLIINTCGKFSKDLSENGGDTIVTKAILLLKRKYAIPSNFKVKIEKNIPLGAGLGGGSANAAAVSRLIFKMYNLKINKKEIINHLSKLGADIPACFFSFNQKVEGFGNKLTKLELLNKNIWILLIKPNVNLSTKEIFKSFSRPFSTLPKYPYNYKNLINDVNHNKNDLQKVAENHSKVLKNMIHRLPITRAMLAVPKMTGSGSTVFILFKKKTSAISYMENIENITKGYWKKISKVIL